MKWIEAERLRDAWRVWRQKSLSRAQVGQWFTRNIALKALSLTLAFGLWTFVNFGERDTEETLKVPLELRNIPAQLMLTSPRVDFIDVRLMGPRTLLGRIDRNRLAIGLDLDGMRPGPAVFRVSGDELNLPRGVKLVRVNPSQVTIELEKVAHKSVPVQLKMVGRLGPEFQVSDTKVAPDTVQVTGPASDIEDVHAAVTEAVDMSRISEGVFERELPLESSGEYVSFSTSRVAAQIRIEELSQTRELKRVAVELRGRGPEWRLAPEAVRVLVRGPRRAVADLDLASVAVYVEAPADKTEPALGVSIDLPDRIQLLAVEPSQVRVVPKRAARSKR